MLVFSIQHPVKQHDGNIKIVGHLRICASRTVPFDVRRFLPPAKKEMRSLDGRFSVPLIVVEDLSATVLCTCSIQEKANFGNNKPPAA